MATTNIINIATACNLLEQGEIVAFPTETVYGLGADADNPVAVAKVFACKNRPLVKPLIVHIADVNQLQDYATDIPKIAFEIAEHYWPGPLTMVLRKNPKVCGIVCGQQDSIALRIPAHKVALQLLQQFGRGLVGPSANKYGRVSPTSAAHVSADYQGEQLAILDGGNCELGIESTILQVTDKGIKLLRPGSISVAHIASKFAKYIYHDNQQLHMPGQVSQHYCPKTPAYLLSEQQAQLVYQRSPEKIAIITQQNIYPLSTSVCMPQDVDGYGQKLYATLRELDELQKSAILVTLPPILPEWSAILDRLQRAASAFSEELLLLE